MNTLKDYVNFRLTHADKVAEAEGYPLKMDNCKKYKKMKQLEIYGNSVQNGTPTPDAPIEVQSVGDLTKNLFNEDKFLDMSRINSNENEWYMTNDALHDANRSYSDDIVFKENTQYTIGMVAKCTGGGGRFKIVYTDGTISYVTAPTTEYTTIVYTSTANKTISYIGGHYNYGGTFYIQKNSMFIYEGTGVTEYEPYGKYKIPVIVRGKNIATAYDVCKGLASYKATVLDGRECVSYHSNWAKWYTDYPFKENTQYIISFDVKSLSTGTNAVLGFNCILGFWYTDGTFGSANYNPPDAAYNNDTGIDVEWRRVVLTSRAGKTVKSIGVDGNHYVMKHHIDVNTFQLEEGAANTGYEPYIEPVTTNIFLDEPLRKLGDYADYIDFKENKVVRKVGESIITSTTFDKTVVQTDRNRIGCVMWISKLPNCLFPNSVSKCNRFLNNFDALNGFWLTDAIYFALPIDTCPSEIEANAWLKSVSESDNPIKFTYPRKMPIEETLNIDLPKLTAKTTIIEVDTNLLPSNIYGKYIKK